MAIGDAIATYLEQTGQTHREFAEKLHFDRSFISKVISGDRNWPEAHDTKLAKLDWRFAIYLADERTGGYISNILDDNPNLDLHPAALKELLLKDLSEAEAALEGLLMAKHLDPEKRREGAEKVWHEVRDVVEKGIVLQGVLEEVFALDREQLIKRHEMQVQKGER